MVWDYSGGVSDIYGKTIGILGTDVTGCAIAQKAKAFGMVPIGVNDHGDALSDFNRVYALDELDTCLPGTAMPLFISLEPRPNNHSPAVWHRKHGLL